MKDRLGFLDLGTSEIRLEVLDARGQLHGYTLPPVGLETNEGILIDPSLEKFRGSNFHWYDANTGGGQLSRPVAAIKNGIPENIDVLSRIVKSLERMAVDDGLEEPTKYVTTIFPDVRETASRMVSYRRKGIEELLMALRKDGFLIESPIAAAYGTDAAMTQKGSVDKESGWSIAEQALSDEAPLGIVEYGAGTFTVSFLGRGLGSIFNVRYFTHPNFNEIDGHDDTYGGDRVTHQLKQLLSEKTASILPDLQTLRLSFLEAERLKTALVERHKKMQHDFYYRKSYVEQRGISEGSMPIKRIYLAKAVPELLETDVIKNMVSTVEGAYEQTMRLQLSGKGDEFDQLSKLHILGQGAANHIVVDELDKSINKQEGMVLEFIPIPDKHALLNGMARIIASPKLADYYALPYRHNA